MGLLGDERIDQPKGIAYSLADYLELVDWTGRAIIDGKRGSIPDLFPPLPERLYVNPDQEQNILFRWQLRQSQRS